MQNILFSFFLLISSQVLAIPIDNLGEVTESIFRGERLDVEEDFELLSTLGVNTIINLQKISKKSSPALCKKYNMNCTHFPIYLHWWPHSDRKFDYEILKEAFSFVLKEVELGKKVYLHCHFGSDRTSALAAAITIRQHACFLEHDSIELLSMINKDLETYGFHKSLYPYLLERIRSWTKDIPEWICK